MLDKYIGRKTLFAECVGLTGTYSTTKKAIVNMLCECGNEFTTSLENVKSTQSKVTCGCRNARGVTTPKEGDIFGDLVHIRYSKLSDTGKPMHLFRCKCGVEKDITLNAVFTGNTTSCGCNKKLNGIKTINDRYAAKRYNSLTFVKHAEKWAGPAEGKNPIALWACDCGTVKEVRINDVVNGKTTCCGCDTGRDRGVSKIGEKYNKLTLISIIEQPTGNRPRAIFKCDCGTELERPISSVVAGNLKSCGCDMSEILREKRGFTLDETVFETITDDSAYWLGFMLADGNVSKNTITLNLKTGDRSHLEKFRSFMGGNQTISLKKDVRMSGYAFGSIKVAKDLAKWGIVPNKSLIAKPHDDLKFNSHFWRGMIDGDGTISNRYSKSIGLCGTKEVCEAFLEFANSIHTNKAAVSKCKPNLWHVRIGVGRKESSKLARALYSNASTYLDRKHKAVIGIIEGVDIHNGD